MTLPYGLLARLALRRKEEQQDPDADRKLLEQGSELLGTDPRDLARRRRLESLQATTQAQADLSRAPRVPATAADAQHVSSMLEEVNTERRNEEELRRAAAQIRPITSGTQKYSGALRTPLQRAMDPAAGAALAAARGIVSIPSEVLSVPAAIEQMSGANSTVARDAFRAASEVTQRADEEVERIVPRGSVGGTVGKMVGTFGIEGAKVIGTSLAALRATEAFAARAGLPALEALAQEYRASMFGKGTLASRIEASVLPAAPYDIATGLAMPGPEASIRERMHSVATNLAFSVGGAAGFETLATGWRLARGLDLATGEAMRLTEPPRPKFQHEPNPHVLSLAQEYNRSVGLPDVGPHEPYRLSPEKGREIADAFEALPQVDEAARPSYDAFRSEVRQQFEQASQEVHFEPWVNEGQPYKDSAEMMADVRNNRHMYVFTGGELHPFLSADDTFMFRAVHDLYGHSKSGWQFGPNGEINATIEHAKMFSEQARPALVSETIGQNSWFNFGRANEGVAIPDRKFAQQKGALLPEALWRDIIPDQGLQVHPWGVEGVGRTIDNSLKLLDATDGATFNPRQGGSLVGRDAYAVNIYPERSLPIEGKPSPEQLGKYLQDNADMFRDQRNSLGLWFDKNTGKTWLDVVATVPDRRMATELGRKYNQIAITYLKDLSEIATGGTGALTEEVLSRAPAIHDRLNSIERELLARSAREATDREALAARGELSDRTVQETEALARKARGFDERTRYRTEPNKSLEEAAFNYEMNPSRENLEALDKVWQEVKGPLHITEDVGRDQFLREMREYARKTAGRAPEVSPADLAGFGDRYGYSAWQERYRAAQEKFVREKLKVVKHGDTIIGGTTEEMVAQQAARQRAAEAELSEIDKVLSEEYVGPAYVKNPETGQMFTGEAHYEAYMKAEDAGLSPADLDALSEHGFQTSLHPEGVDRGRAYEVHMASGLPISPKRFQQRGPIQLAAEYISPFREKYYDHVRRLEEILKKHRIDPHATMLAAGILGGGIAQELLGPDSDVPNATVLAALVLMPFRKRLKGGFEPLTNVARRLAHMGPRVEVIAESARRLIMGRANHLYNAPRPQRIRAGVREALAESKVAIRRFQQLGRDPRQWYRQSVEEMQQRLYKIFPELRDPHEMWKFRAILATASNGNSPLNNMRQALELWEAKQQGINFKYAKKTSLRSQQILEDVQALEDLIREFGNPNRKETIERVADMLGTEVDVWVGKQGDPDRVRRRIKVAELGSGQQYIDPRTGETRTAGRMPFGPKIGAFFLNLDGDLSRSTIDIWAVRTYRRLMGYMSAVPSTRFNRGLGHEMDMLDAEGKVIFGKLDSHITESERYDTHEIFRQVSDRLSSETGQEWQPADVQALFWYYEKDLYAQAGAKPELGVDFSEALRQVQEARAQQSLFDQRTDAEIALDRVTRIRSTRKLAADRRRWLRRKGRQTFLGTSVFERPLYHATTAKAEFNEFLMSDMGAHFGTREQARARAKYKADRGEFTRTESFYVRTENPFYMPDMGDWEPSAVIHAIGQIAREEDITSLSHVANDPQAIWLDIKKRAEEAAGIHPYENVHPFGPVDIRDNKPQLLREWSERYREAVYGDIRRMLNDAGYDGVAYFNAGELTPRQREISGKIVPYGDFYGMEGLSQYADELGLRESVIVWDNRQIRSTKAKFKDITSTNIRGAVPVQVMVGMAGAAAAAASQGDEDWTTVMLGALAGGAVALGAYGALRYALRRGPMAGIEDAESRTVQQFMRDPEKAARAITEIGPNRPQPLVGMKGAVQRQTVVSEIAPPLGVHDFDVHINRIRGDASGLAELNTRVARLKREGRLSRRPESFNQVRGKAKAINVEQTLRSEGVISGPEGLALREMYNENETFLEAGYKMLNELEPNTEEYFKMQSNLLYLEERQDAILGRFIPGASAVGRSLNALKIMANRTLDPLTWHTRALRQMGRGGILTTEIKANIAKYISQGDRLGLVNYIRTLGRELTWRDLDFWTTIRRAGLISAPVSAGRAIFGNSINVLSSVVASPATHAVDVVLAGLMSTPRARAFADAEITRAAMRGAKQGLSEMMPALRGHIGMVDIATKMDLPPMIKFKNSMTDFWVNLPFRVQGALDRPFRTASYFRSLAEQAKVMAKIEGLTGEAAAARRKYLLEHPTLDMVMRAGDESERMVFQNRTAIADAVSRLRSTDNPLFRAGVDVAIPFSRTPSAVVASGIESTPVGALATIGDLYKLWRASGNATDAEIRALQRETSRRAGRWLTFTTAVLIGYGLYQSGHMTAERPKGSKGQEFDRQGRLPYAIRIGSRYHSLAQAQPLAAPLAFGATLAQHRAEQEGWPSSIAYGTASVGQLALKTPFFQGVQDVVDVLSGEGRSPGQVLSRTAASMVPQGIASTARAMDNVVREARTTREAFEARVPGLSQRVPPKINPETGEVATRESNIASQIWFALADVTGSRRVPEGNPVTDEVVRVGAAIPDVKQEEGETRSAYTARRQKLGKAVYNHLSEVVRSPAYQAMKLDTPEETMALQASVLQEEASQIRSIIDQPIRLARFRAGLTRRLVMRVPQERIRRGREAAGVQQ